MSRMEEDVVQHLVSLRATLSIAPPVTADGVTDLIEKLVDALDDTGFVADVSTSGVGHTIQIDVSVEVDGPELHALDAGISAIVKAFAHAQVDGLDSPRLHDLIPSVRPLEYA